MKKKILLSLIFALLMGLCANFSSAFCPADSNSQSVAYSNKLVLATEGADSGGEGDGESVPDEEPTLTQTQINKLFQKGHVVSPSNHIVDSILYGRLLDVVTENAKALGYTFTGDELYSEMFTTFAVEDKVMNITEIVIQDDLIESLEGLEYLRLDNIRKFVVSSNKLKSVNSTVFQNMENLEYLSFANNEITSCDLTALKNLEYVNLSSNNLTSIDLSSIITANIEIILSNNNFTDMSNIKLPNRAHSIKLDIMSNNIADIPEEYFNISKLNLRIGVQGIKSLNKVSKINTAQTLNVYRLNNPNLRFVIYKIDNLIERNEYKIVTDADFNSTTKCVSVEFPVGDYLYEYEILSGSEYVPAYDKYDEVKKVYAPQEFKVVPQGVTYVYEYKGKMYNSVAELGKVTGLIKIHLSCEDGGKIYLNNNSQWVETNIIECNGGGSKTLQVKVVKDGYESDITSIKVETSLNGHIPDFLMFALVFAFALILFVVVIPIVSKKFFRK